MKYANYYNHELGNGDIYSRKDILNMTLNDIINNELPLSYQYNTIGIPDDNELTQSLNTHQYTDASGKSRWRSGQADSSQSASASSNASLNGFSPAGGNAVIRHGMKSTKDLLDEERLRGQAVDAQNQALQSQLGVKTGGGGGFGGKTPAPQAAASSEMFDSGTPLFTDQSIAYMNQLVEKGKNKIKDKIKSRKDKSPIATEIDNVIQNPDPLPSGSIPEAINSEVLKLPEDNMESGSIISDSIMNTVGGDLSKIGDTDKQPLEGVKNVLQNGVGKIANLGKSVGSIFSNMAEAGKASIIPSDDKHNVLQNIGGKIKDGVQEAGNLITDKAYRDYKGVQRDIARQAEWEEKHANDPESTSPYPSSYNFPLVVNNNDGSIIDRAKEDFYKKIPKYGVPGIVPEKDRVVLIDQFGPPRNGSSRRNDANIDQENLTSDLYEKLKKANIGNNNDTILANNDASKEVNFDNDPIWTELRDGLANPNLEEEEALEEARIQAEYDKKLSELFGEKPDSDNETEHEFEQENSPVLNGKIEYDNFIPPQVSIPAQSSTNVKTPISQQSQIPSRSRADERISFPVGEQNSNILLEGNIRKNDINNRIVDLAREIPQTAGKAINKVKNNVLEKINSIYNNYQGLTVPEAVQKLASKSPLPITMREYYGISTELNDNNKSMKKYKKNNDFYKLSDLKDKDIVQLVSKNVIQNMGLDPNDPNVYERIKDVDVVIPKKNSHLYNLIKNSEQLGDFLLENYDAVKANPGKRIDSSIQYGRPNGEFSKENLKQANLHAVFNRSDISIKANPDGSIIIYHPDFYNFAPMGVPENANLINSGIVYANNNAVGQQEAGQLRPYSLTGVLTLSKEEVEELMQRRRSQRGQ